MAAPSNDFFRKLLAELGEDDLARAPGVAAWIEATDALLAAAPPAERGRALSGLAKSWHWKQGLAAVAEVEPSGWATAIQAAVQPQYLGSEALAVIASEARTHEDAVFAVVAREALLARLMQLGDGPLADILASDTHAAIALLEALRDAPPSPVGSRMRGLFPELAGLTIQGDALSSVDHERASELTRDVPLLDHLSRRVLARKLLGLERGDRRCFQRDEALGAEAFASEVARLERLRAHELVPCVRAALIHLDFAKGGDRAQREHWRLRLGADLTIHNLAARLILQKATPRGSDTPGLLSAFSRFRQSRALAELVLALVESHGLAGQAVRGETPLASFAPFIVYLRRERDELARALGVDVDEAARLALDCLHLVNVCDTAGVREGILDDALAREFLSLRDHLDAVAAIGDARDEVAVEQELAASEDDLWQRRLPTETALGRSRQRLLDRLSRLRSGRLRRGEPPDAMLQAVAALHDRELERLAALLVRCQFWYAEAGSAALSPEGQLKVLALAMTAAERALGTANSAFHVSLLPLVRALHDSGERSTPYRVRLIDTMLASLSFAEILSPAAADPLAPAHPLGTFATEIGGARAVELTFRETPEASALLTLLPIYETKSSAAFHTTLKTLCDLYGLRKDEFDRVANEGLYLATMNSSRPDKQRMLDHVRPGKIVEIGPGGGVVLDLLEQRFEDSEVIGIDASHMVVQALRQRREQEGRRWQVIEADAFKLPEIVGEQSVDSVVFCSVLHEIYSYVPYPNASGVIGRFRLEAVRDLLKAAYRTLARGGRLVIRDGVMPPAGVRILRFVVPEAREFFELFCREFEGRRITAEPAGQDRVRLSSADAMEFLYTYTWGPESFPYEVREQYGVLPYDVYRAHLLDWLSGESPPRWVALPDAEASYLQPGYRKALAGKVELFDEQGRPTELPDSNCLLIVEKG